ncbi:hypothetical protein [Dactylosporangium salmoneum]|uniref:Uncharacterized protein n=1 Tax=Dactylosporangium salmoneum TaxID=53361 RepID=A0ABN3GAS2_9ACTN
MTAQPTPTMGAQPTGRKSAQGAHPAQPTAEVGGSAHAHPAHSTQPTPNLGARPTGLAPAGAAQPIQPTAHHGQPAHWAFGAAAAFWAVGALAHWAGCPAQGYAGVVLGGVALGVSIAHAAAHNWAAHRARRQPTGRADEWAPISAAQARAALRLITAQIGSEVTK